MNTSIKNLHLYDNASLCWLGECDPKPVLRPLQDITEAEFREAAEIIYPKGDFTNEEFNIGFGVLKENGAECVDFGDMDVPTVAKLVAFYISKGFDLGLLEPGTFILKS